ncbi:MAG: hypothetical protein RLZZ337_465, partial [Bacteroidota bacterium]
EYKKILVGAAELFMRVGIKSVSMDDIARDLGISKKTIYKHFNDKRDLVSKVMDGKISTEQNMCTQHFDNDENAIQKMINLSKYISQANKSMNHAVLYDLQKYYPSQWKKFESFRVGFISESIRKNIETGMAEGVFRSTIKPDIISRIYVLLIQGLMKLLTEQPSDYDFVTIYKQMITYHLYGICSAEGLTYLEQHINEI